jgi:lipoate-protein ligase A
MSKVSWTTIIREKASAEANMSMDAMLLRRLACMQQPVLHLYDWISPSITHGYFVDPKDLLSMEVIESMGIDLARRPTGGGVLAHTTDLAFSILIPANHPNFSTNTLENYAFINRLVAGVVRQYLSTSEPVELLPCCDSGYKSQLPFCMADPTAYDVMIGGRKVAGGAQRRTKHGYLHQGSISLALPEQGFLEAVLKDPSVAEMMRQKTYPLAGQQNIHTARKEVAELLQDLGSALYPSNA